MKTQIYATYSDFLARTDKDVNGMSPEFAAAYPDVKNDTNKGCWNCSDCSGCYRCSGCSGCSDCSDCSDCSGCSGCYRCSGCSGKKQVLADVPAVPVIPSIHKAILEAVESSPDALNMRNWHTCETTHCRGGWVVTLAGEPGKKLEAETSTLFAAMQIYHASSPISVSPVRFFDDEKTAMEDMRRCAKEEEAALATA